MNRTFWMLMVLVLCVGCGGVMVDDDYDADVTEDADDDGSEADVPGEVVDEIEDTLEAADVPDSVEPDDAADADADADDAVEDDGTDADDVIDSADPDDAEDVPDEAPEPDAACDTTTCIANCIAEGYDTGACVGGGAFCTCYSGSDADADADTDVEPDTDGDADADADADVTDTTDTPEAFTYPSWLCTPCTPGASDACGLAGQACVTEVVGSDPTLRCHPAAPCWPGWFFAYGCCATYRRELLATYWTCADPLPDPDGCWAASTPCTDDSQCCTGDCTPSGRCGWS